MNLKKIQNELLVTNDLMRLKGNELISKYCGNETDCEEMLQILSGVFYPGTNYSISLFYYYDKITKFLDECLLKFPENKIVKTNERYLKKGIEIEKGIDSDMADYAAQAAGLFEYAIGANRIEDLKTMEDLQGLLLKGSFDLEDALSDNTDLKECNEVLKKAQNVSSSEGKNSYIKKTLVAFSLGSAKFRLCFDPKFLVAANYLILGYHPFVVVDDEFISLVKEIIDFTLNSCIKNEIIDEMTEYDKKQYKKLAKLTSRNIAKLEKAKQEQVEKNLQYEKNLSKTK